MNNSNPQISTLVARHRHLDSIIRTEENSSFPNLRGIRQMKVEKLNIKDHIFKLSGN
jgi:uncharacterized protein YdcH (DUF465 family)